MDSSEPQAPEPLDDKYVVFKRSDLDAIVASISTLRNGTVDAEIYLEMKTMFETACLNDAVVIRTQDIFAGPVLHLYAAQMEVAAQLAYDADAAADLRWIGAYFKRRAIQADKGDHKFPD